MTVAKNIVLSETLYVSRDVKRKLYVLASLFAASSGTDIPNVDALANEVLSKHLESLPHLQEREDALKKALKEIDAQFKIQEPPSS